MIMTITDEMVLKAAEALEWKTTAKSYGWTREEFDIWWNKDPAFVTRINGWGYFTGTQKEKLLFETRIVLEAAFDVR